jgi:hypothetical protein
MQKLFLFKTILVLSIAISPALALAEECKDTSFCSIIESSDPPEDLGIKGFVAGGYNTTTLKDYDYCDCITWRIVDLAFACDQWECFSTHDVIVPATTTWVYATITNPYLTTSSTSGTSSSFVYTIPYNNTTATSGSSTALIDASWTFGELFIAFLMVFFIGYTLIKDILRFFFPDKVRILRIKDAL